MTNNQALAKARMLWGKRACVEDSGKPSTTKSGAILAERFKVGRVMLGMFFEVLGDGISWEAAFESAERKDQEWKKKWSDTLRETTKGN